MTHGPVELVVLQAPRGESVAWSVAALREPVDSGFLRIIDVAFVHTAADGSVSTSELSDLDEATYSEVAPIVGEVTGLIADRDLVELGDAVEPGRSAGVLLIEHRWPHRLGERAQRAGGKVLLHLRVPRETVTEVTAARRLSAPGQPRAVRRRRRAGSS